MANKAMSAMDIITIDNIDGTERFLVQGDDGSIILLSAISTYTLTNLLASTAYTSVTDSDEFLIERGDAAIKVDEQYIRSRILGKAFDSSDGSAAQTGDLVLIERAGTVYTLDVDDIITYAGALSTDISGLDDASLGDGVYFLIGEDSTPTKTTLSSLETQLWADFDTYLTGLSAVATLADSDAFYVLDNGVPQKITASTIATYVTSEKGTGIIAAAYDVDAIESLASGDEFICETSDTPKTTTIDDIDTYVQNSIAGTSNTATSFTGTDEIYLERSDAIYKIDVDYLTDYVVESVFDNTTNVPVVTELVAGDDILLGRGTDTVRQITWENLAGQIQPTVLTHSGLTECEDPKTTDTLIIGDASDTTEPKKVTLSNIETAIWPDWQTYYTALDAVTTVAASDKIPLNQGGTAYHVTPALLATYVESTISSITTGDVFDGATLDPIASEDIVAVERDGVLKSADVDEFADFSIETLFGKTALDPTENPAASGDILSVYRTDTAYTADIDDIASYVVSTIGGDGTQTTLASGDMLNFERANDSYKIDIDNVVTHVLTGVQADVLDISGLNAATLNETSADQFLVVQSGAAKRTDYATLAASFHGNFKTYTHSTLDDIVNLADADEFYVYDDSTTNAKKSTAFEMYTYVDDTIWSEASALTTLTDSDTFLMRKSGDTYYTTFSNLADEISDEVQADISDVLLSAAAGWAEISSDSYTATPGSTTFIAMSDTSDVAVGLPLKYTYNSTDYYGIVHTVVEDTYIIVDGAPMNTSYPLTALYVGPASKVRQEEFFIDSIYDDAVQDCLAEVAERNYKWQLGDAYLVSFSAVNHWPDTGATQPYVNVKIDGDLVSTNSTNKGIQVSATADTWTDNMAAAINASNYKIERGDAVEIRCTAAGTNGDAECLTVSCTFVFEG